MKCLWLACVLSAAPIFAQEVHEVKVGHEMLRIPTPEGFARLDGITEQQDRLSAQLAGVGNRLVILFGTPEAAQEVREGKPLRSPRSFNIQVENRLELASLTPDEFEELRRESETSLTKLGRRFDALLGKGLDGVAKSLSESLHKEVSVKVGEPVPLGIFERTRDSLGFSLMFKTRLNVGGQETTGLNVVGVMIARVRGKCLYLYASSEHLSEADVLWVRGQVKTWRDAIFTANGQTDAPPAATPPVLQPAGFLRILLAAAALGGLLLLVLHLSRRGKNPRPN